MKLILGTKMIEGLSHITLLVEDLEKTSKLFQMLFQAEEVYSSDLKNFSLSKEKFFLIGGVWIALMEGKPPARSYQHLAFKITEEDLPRYKKRIEVSGLELLLGRFREPEEGKSLYFYDYDDHLFELHTETLERRLTFYNQSSPCLLKPTASS